MFYNYKEQMDDDNNMAIYKSEGDKPWKVLDDYTFSVLAEFATCREAEKYAHNNGQSDILSVVMNTSRL